MAESSCLLFPSYTEGMPLTLARAVQIGIPVIASDIPPVVEMAGSEEGLLEPGNLKSWNRAISFFITTKTADAYFPVANVPTLAAMADAVENIYNSLS